VNSQHNVLVGGVALLLVGVMSAQQNLADVARDSRKTASESQASRPVHREPPVYPQEARAKGIEGNVVLAIVVDKQGNVIRARVVEGDKIFWKAALTAIKAWKFSPAAAEGTHQIKMRFCPTNCG